MRYLIGVLFAVSGVSALIYQVAWQRILALHSGVGIYSVAMIVAAFLAGLGIGSYAGGVASTGMRRRAALRWFAVLELGVGAFALVSCFLYYDLLHGRLPWLFARPALAGMLHFAVLLPPTIAMGMGLPFLLQAMVLDRDTAPRTIGRYYGLNVLGAALGALLTPWVFIRWAGIPGAVAIGAAGNLAVGLLALFAGRRIGERAAVAPAPPREETSRAPAGGRAFPLWLALYTLSGFCSLSLEMLWFRVLDVAVKSTAFTFGTVLSLFLLGIGAGSLVGGSLAATLHRPLRVFLACQTALLLYAGAALLLLVALPTDLPLYQAYVAYWGSYEGFQLGGEWAWGLIVALYAVLPLCLYAVPTFLMGVSFAALQRAVQDDVRTTGFKVGVLQAGNILGNVAGSLLTGLLLLTLLGTPGTLRLLLLLGLVFPVLALSQREGRRVGFAVGALGLVGVALALPAGQPFWARLHGTPAAAALVDEDATAVGAIVPAGAGFTVAVNGKGHSTLPFGGIHSTLGAVPALVHPAPRQVAIVGLGSGDTAWAAGARAETRSVRVFELGAPEERLLRRIAERAPLPALRRFLSDPRVSIETADGRTALATGRDRYDLIEADALRPHSAYSGNVYSVEFFRLAAASLAPGGVVCSWAPTRGIHRSFLEALPHALEFPGAILVGSESPLEVAPEAWLRRLAAARGYLGPEVSEEVARTLRGGRLADPGRVAGVAPNRDLVPRDEFRSR